MPLACILRAICGIIASDRLRFLDYYQLIIKAAHRNSKTDRKTLGEGLDIASRREIRRVGLELELSLIHI